MAYIPNPLIIPIGVMIGVLVAAPVGPVNVLCIQRALHRGVFAGVAAGMGAVLGDGLIALGAALGISQINDMVTYYRGTIQVVGGVVLLLFGVSLMSREPQVADEGAADAPGQWRDYMWDASKAFFLTITNPGAVLGLLAIFGGIGSFVALRGRIDAFVLVAAIMAGSLGWWLFLATVVTRIRGRFGKINLKRINQIAGVALIAFGLILVGEMAWVWSRQLANET